MSPSSPESNLSQSLDPSWPRSLCALSPSYSVPHPDYLRAFLGPTSYFFCPPALPPCLGAILPFFDWSTLPARRCSLRLYCPHLSSALRPQVEILDGRTECVLSNLRGRTRYTFMVRARMAEPSFDGFWSAWSEPASLLTASGEAPGRGVEGAGAECGASPPP